MMMVLIDGSGSGVLLQQFVDQYDALPLILPVTSSLAGNVGCIFASRLATAFNSSKGAVHRTFSFTSRDNLIVMSTLFAISLPIHMAFLGFVQLLGAFAFGILFLIAYLVTGGLSVNHRLSRSSIRLLHLCHWPMEFPSSAGLEGIIQTTLY